MYDVLMYVCVCKHTYIDTCMHPYIHSCAPSPLQLLPGGPRHDTRTRNCWPGACSGEKVGDRHHRRTSTARHSGRQILLQMKPSMCIHSLYIYIHMCMYTTIHLYRYTYTHIPARTYACTNSTMHRCICTYIYICCIHTHLYTDIHIYIYAYVYMHIKMHVRIPSLHILSAQGQKCVFTYSSLVARLTVDEHDMMVNKGSYVLLGNCFCRPPRLQIWLHTHPRRFSVHVFCSSRSGLRT